MKLKGSRSVSVSVAINLVASVLLRCINIITAPVITEMLDESGYGAMSIYGTWCSIAMIVFGLQANGSLTNAYIRYEDKKTYYLYCWNALIVSSIMHIVLICIIFILLNPLARLTGLKSILLIIMPVQSFMQVCISFLNTHYIIENKAQKNLYISLVNSVASFGLSYYLVTQTSLFMAEPYMGFIIGHFVLYSFLGVFSFLFFLLKGGGKIRAEYVQYCLGFSLPLVFHSLSGLVLGQSDRIMLQYIDGFAVAGVYSFIYTFASIVDMLWGAINSIWLPFYYKYLNAGDLNILKRHIGNYDRLFFTLSAGFLLLYPEVFHTLVNNRYWSQIDLIPLIVIGFYWGHMYGYYVDYELYKEKTMFIALGTSCTAIINIVLNYIFIPHCGAKGAALATMVSYMLLYLLHFAIVHFAIKGCPIYFWEDIVRIIPVFGVVGISYVFSSFAIVRWGIGVAIGIAYIIRFIKTKELI